MEKRRSRPTTTPVGTPRRGRSRFGVACAMVAVGAAIGAAATAGAATTPAKAGIPAMSATQVGADQHATRPSRVVLRQRFAYSRQATHLQGIRLSAPLSGTQWGAPARVRATIGGKWRCSNGVAAWRGTAIAMKLIKLARPRTCQWGRDTAAGFVLVRAKGARLVSDLGQVRIGQRWAKAPAKLRRAAISNKRRGAQRVVQVGYVQDVCGRVGAGEPKRPLMQFHVSPAGRIIEMRSNLGVIEGFNCDEMPEPTPTPAPTPPITTPSPAPTPPTTGARKPTESELDAITESTRSPGSIQPWLCPEMSATWISADGLWAVTNGVTNCGSGSGFEYRYLQRSSATAADWSLVDIRAGGGGGESDRCGSSAVPEEIRCPSAYAGA